MYDLVTFGEAMIRLTAPDFMRLEQVSSLEITAGGAEMNVAVNAAQLGLRTAWVSRLVDNWSGRYIRNKGRELGVDMSNIVWADFDSIISNWVPARVRAALRTTAAILRFLTCRSVRLIGNLYLAVRVGFISAVSHRLYRNRQRLSRQRHSRRRAQRALKRVTI